MSKRSIESTSLPEPDQPGIALYDTHKKSPLRTIIRLCALVLILSILVSVAPLLHLAGKTYLLSIPTNPFLLLWGAWLPYDLHLTQPPRASMLDTNDISLAVLLLLQFTFYALCAMAIRRLPIQGDGMVHFVG